jgi:uncharacterized protein with gpF-like domain
MTTKTLSSDFTEGYRQGYLNGLKDIENIAVKLAQNNTNMRYIVVTQEQYEELKSLAIVGEDEIDA